MAPQPQQAGTLSEPLLVSITSNDSVPVTVETVPDGSAAGSDAPILPSVNSPNGHPPANGKPSLKRSLTVVDGVRLVNR